MTPDIKNNFQWKNIRFVPVLHNRVEFAVEVRRQFEQFQPDQLAVEYPQTLKNRILDGIDRLPLLSVVHYQEDDGAFTYLLLEPTDGQVEAIRLCRENHIPVHFVDRDTESYPLHHTAMPDPYAVKRIGHFAYCQSYVRSSDERSYSRDDRLREQTMAYYLQRLSENAERVLFVGGLYHLPGLLSLLDRPQAQVIGRVRRKGVALAHLHLDSSREIMSEMPFLAATYERSRNAQPSFEVDRLQCQNDLIKAARRRHRQKNKEDVSQTEIKILNTFARNYALLSSQLVPNFYQLIVASRGAVDDDFAYEIWKIGCEYPWQAEEPGLQVLRLRGEDLFLDQKRIRFHRRLKSMRRRLVSVPVKKRANERFAREWRQGFKGVSICSYPPEDLVIEGYGRYLQKKALEIRTEDNCRIEPFTTSLHDGLDVRQTIREWGSGNIFIKVGRPFRGKVGSVVMIFDSDLAGKDGRENFPWRVTWLGENEQESDMAFYSTPAGEIMDGPGISRCHYGGFMLTYPPLRVFDIWKDPFFDFARNKPERLLVAALDYSLEKHVVYAAPTPPSGWCQSIASHLGKQIIYLPIGIFSPVTLKRIRRFHVLDGHHVRKYARQYI
jgi:hypothetical protein